MTNNMETNEFQERENSNSTRRRRSVADALAAASKLSNSQRTTIQRSTEMPQPSTSTTCITSISDCIALLQNRPYGLEEQEDVFLDGATDVLEFAYGTNSRRMMENTYREIADKQNVFSSYDDEDAPDRTTDEWEDNYALLLKALLLFTETKLLYSHTIRQSVNSRYLDQQVQEGLRVTSAIIAKVAAIYTAHGLPVSFTDKYLSADRSSYRQDSKWLLSPADNHIMDEIQPESTKEVYETIDRLLERYQEPLKAVAQCNLEFSSYLEDLNETLVTTLAKPQPIRQEIQLQQENIDHEEEGVGIMSALGIIFMLSLFPWIILWTFHLLAYIPYYMTFTLINFPATTGGWLDWYKGIWLYPTAFVAVLSTIYYTFRIISVYTRNRMAKEDYKKQCKQAEDAFQKEIQETNAYNEQLKKRLSERFH